MSLPQKDACKQCQDKHPKSICPSCPEHSHDYGKQPCRWQKRFLGENSEYCGTLQIVEKKRREGKIK